MEKFLKRSKMAVTGAIVAEIMIMFQVVRIIGDDTVDWHMIMILCIVGIILIAIGSIIMIIDDYNKFIAYNDDDEDEYEYDEKYDGDEYF